MLKELIEKRSKLVADRKTIVEKAEKENRVLTAEEKEAVKKNEVECDDIAETVRASNRVTKDQADSLEYATRAAAGRQDTENPLEGDFDDKTLAKYSICRVLRAIDKGKEVDGLEKELSQHIARKAGRPAKGIFVPTRVLAHRQAAAVTTTTGVGSILTTVSGNYIDALRALTITGKLGVTFMGGLQGTFGIPRTSNISSYWVTEGNAPTDGAITIDQVVLSPKTIGARSDFTRAFLNQTSVDVESLASNLLLKQLAVGIDTAAVQGTGTSGQPLGILNNTNCSYYELANASSGVGTGNLNTGTGGTMTWAAAVALESLVAGANVMIDSGAYVTTPAGNGSWKTQPRITGAAAGFISEDGEVNGYPVLASNVLPIANGTNNAASSAIFGNWSAMYIGNWGGLDLMRDPYALSTSGGLRVIALQDVDIELAQALSFACIHDIKP